MATDLYPNLNSVRSSIIEEDIQEQRVPPSSNVILIFGTATKGPLQTPTRVDVSNITTIFGSVPTDPYYNTSLVKGFWEIKKTVQTADVIAVRVGTATKASLNLYENRTFTSGDYSPSVAGTDTLSMTLEAKTAGPITDYFATVVGSTSGDPTKIDIAVGSTTVSYDLSVDGSVPGAYNRVSELVNAINANTDLNGSIVASMNVLSGTTTIDITQLSGAPSGAITPTYNIDGGSESWGDKIVDLLAVYQSATYSDDGSVTAGSTSATLERTPVKAAGSTTIPLIYSRATNDVFVTAISPAYAGQTQFYLGGSATALLTDGYDATASTPIKNLRVYRWDASSASTVEITEGVGAAQYTWNLSNLTVTLNTAIDGTTDLNDKLYATYDFATTYSEQFYRSALVSGNKFSYFVGGDTILFGAAQKYNLELQYTAKTQYTLGGDVTVYNADTSTIKFMNPSNMPSVGDTITVEFVYEPELPAKAGATLSSGNVQESSLTGGSDGRNMTTATYYNELAKGYIAADNTPCRFAVPQGVYIDDVMDGIDYESGLAVSTNAGFHTQLSTFVQRKSQYVSECTGVIGVRPIITSNPAEPTATEKETWYTKLVTVSATDTTRAANIMNAVTDYHLDIVAGDVVGSMAEVLSNSSYVALSANIYAAMKWAHDNMASMLNKRVPGSWISGIVYPIVTADRVNAINTKRYTLLTNHAQDGSLIVADAPTGAASTSQFTRQYVRDITFEAVNRVRTTLDPFIGQRNVAATRQAMETAAKIQLQEMSPDKLISFDIKVQPDATNPVSGKTRVRLILTTAVEIRQVNIETRVKLGL